MWEISDYRFAENPPDAVRLMRELPGRGIYLAGGTDLLRNRPGCDYVVDISRAGIDTIARTPDGDVFIGAATPLQVIAGEPLLEGFADEALSRAAARCGTRSVRSTGTIGGNLCSALPTGDLAPVLLALDATCFITDVDSQESLPLQDFFVAPGQTVLADRLLVGIALPATAGCRRCATHKLTRPDDHVALVQVAVAADLSGDGIRDVRIALGSVAPTPMRSTLAEAILEDFDRNSEEPETLVQSVLDAARIAAGESEPVDDELAGAGLRRERVREMTQDLLARILDLDPGRVASAAKGAES